MVGNATDLSEGVTLVAQRLDFVDALEGERRAPRDLVECLDHSRSTVTRALRELREAGLVERVSGEYTATPKASLLAEEYRTFRRHTEAVLDAAAVLEPLDPPTEFDPEVLVDSDVHLAGGACNRPLEALHRKLAAAERYRALLPAVDDPRHVRGLSDRVATGDVTAEVVVTPAVLGMFQEEFGPGVPAATPFSIYLGDLPPFGLVLLDSEGDVSVSVVVFDENWNVHGSLYGDSGSTVQWAEDLYDRYRGRAKEVTDLLRDADRDATTG